MMNDSRRISLSTRFIVVAGLVFGVWTQVEGFASFSLFQGGENPSPSVGVPARIQDIVLPGSELEKADVDFSGSIVLRVIAAREHGTAFRYDLEYYGLDPGTHDLRDYLVRKDGSSKEDLPPLEVTIRSILPAGAVTPNELGQSKLVKSTSYEKWLILASVVWILGLLFLLMGWRKSTNRVEEFDHSRPLTLADRLRPLVQQAIDGTLPKERLANLEMSLVAYWRNRLELGEVAPHRIIGELRRHEDAGPLLCKLEEWLHHPNPDESVDLALLLSPYKDLPPDTLPHQEPDQAMGLR